MSAVFSHFTAARVLVIGDFILDLYTIGSVDRISPEAPVPVLRVDRSEHLLGGAGNVALNIKALGGVALPLGRLGIDAEGELLKELLQKEGFELAGLFSQRHFPTPCKNRLLADAQQLMRVDREAITPLERGIEKEMLAFAIRRIEEIEVIAISDYGKGGLSPSLIRALIDLGSRHGIPVIVDPKGDDFAKYRGATLIKPNLREACRACHLSELSSLDVVGHALLESTGVEMAVITRSHRGLSLFRRGGKRVDFSAVSKEVRDVTGAGDTVFSMLAISFASKIDLHEGLHLANLAAGIAVEKIGCTSVSLSEVAERFLTSDNERICSGSDSVALAYALAGKRVTILGFHSLTSMPSLFGHIQNLAKRGNQERLVLSPVDAHLDSASVAQLSFMREVDLVVQLEALVGRIRPDRIFLLDMERLFRVESLEALLSGKRGR